MITCTRCEGFAPPSLSCCPHCDAPIESAEPSRATKLLKRAGQVAAAAATAMTLMACYGAPDDYQEPDPRETDPVTACNDAESLPMDMQFSDDNFSEGTSSALDLTCSEYTNGGERIYRFSAPSDGSLQFSWNSDQPVSVGVRAVCTDNDESLCEAPSVDGSFELAMAEGEDAFIIIERYGSANYDFTASFTPAP